ncbi:hypothetical protein LS684_13270 [Cytobacillus spongiae]|jgi:hypothetical protein|uniref:hypothetical protein n=1 Tax=Cytobacillus spongiae TaxID=2901381 RepID=UPI001F39E4A4|nr:hypothetical protein [Cytobacillus spongiae]UII54630.1 hypothetical protein LS684_13270 [Cytobacillus spongiae]
MTYIIENANILSGKGLTKASLFIQQGKISSVKSSFKKYSHMRMNADPYYLTVPHIPLVTNIPVDKPFLEMKTFFTDELISKGCTAFLTYVEVKQEYLFEEALKKMKTQLLSSPIDYIICVKISSALLTTSFIRKCKREKVPGIFIEFGHEEELMKIPWGWIKEALFPYNCPLIPVVKQENERAKKKVISEWNELVQNEKLPAFQEELTSQNPLTLQQLARMGIYPLKACIQPGREVSYNLYRKSRQIMNVEHSELFHYHSDMLMVTVHKGQVIRAGQKIDFRPGFGEHVKIVTPSYFQIDVD